MAWRINQEIVRGEIDNRVKGKVTGTLLLAGLETPIVLDLKGNACQDLAGCLLTFLNPQPERAESASLNPLQEGICGQLTASRKVRIPTVPTKELKNSVQSKQASSQLGNSLYLEWFSEINGRVVVEAIGFDLQLSEPLWRLSDEEEKDRQEQSQAAMTGFIGGVAAALSDGEQEEDSKPIDDGEESDPVIDQILRINDLKYQAEQLCDGEMVQPISEPLPLDVEEQFWENVVAFESAPMVKRRELLALDGAAFREPESLSESEIHAGLWVLITALAKRRIYLSCTDHLSDRELYALLVDEILEEETAEMPEESGWRSHVLIYEYGVPGDEDGQITYLRYYADEATRKQWADDFPGVTIPLRESPPFDRDSRLPQDDSEEPDLS